MCFPSEASALSAALQLRKIITSAAARVKRRLNAAALLTDLKLMSAEAEGRDPWLITEPQTAQQEAGSHSRRIKPATEKQLNYRIKFIFHDFNQQISLHLID